MVDLRKLAAGHLAWWRRENTVPLIKNYYPFKLPFGGLDVDIPAKDMAERALRNAEALHDAPAPQDCLVTAGVNFAPAFYPATAGAAWQVDRHTSWTIPTASRAADVRIGKFDPGLPVFASFIERMEALLAHWSWDTYLPVLPGHDGVADILAGFLGPETLALELYESPADVRAAAEMAAAFMCDLIAFEKRLFQSAGVFDEGGMATTFGTFQPGWATVFVEDFTALIGPEHYREFFLEYDRRLIEQFDTALFHTHSAGYRNIPEMLKVPASVAFEFGNDPKGPDPAQRIAVVREILASGRPAVCGSWNIPLPDADVTRIVTSLPPQGLDLRFQCRSEAEARDLYQRIKEETAR